MGGSYQSIADMTFINALRARQYVTSEATKGDDKTLDARLGTEASAAEKGAERCFLEVC
jgi:hypothetical protein